METQLRFALNSRFGRSPGPGRSAFEMIALCASLPLLQECRCCDVVMVPFDACKYCWHHLQILKAHLIAICIGLWAFISHSWLRAPYSL